MNYEKLKGGRLFLQKFREHCQVAEQSTASSLWINSQWLAPLSALEISLVSVRALICNLEAFSIPLAHEAAFRILAGPRSSIPSEHLALAN